MTNIEERDTLMKITQLNPGFSLSDVIPDADQFQVMIKSASPTVSGVLNDSAFIQTKSTRKIQTINWPKDED